MDYWDGYEDDFDFDFERTEFVKKAQRPFTYKGVQYVFKTNSKKGGEFYELHRRLQQTKTARIKFRMRAYSASAVGPEDALSNYVAVFVAKEDLPIVIEAVEKLTQELLEETEKLA